MSRFWGNTQPIRVTTDEAGVPRAFSWCGRHYQVAHLANAWRFDDGWWEQRIWRDYFKVATNTRMLVVLYHDLCTDGWFLNREYD
jgi:hypothetical protein